MNLTISQLTALAAGAGFSGDDLATAVAIALAESEGNPQAYNPEKAAGAAQGHGSFGLWQIYITAHPEFASENLLDPQTNAAAAFAIYTAAGNSFRLWSTFTNGAYQAYVSTVTAFLNAANPPAGTDTETPDSSPAASGDGGAFSTGELFGLAIAGGVLLWGVMELFN